MFLKIFVKIHIVGRDHYCPACSSHPDILRSKSMASASIHGYTVDDLPGIAIDKIDLVLGVELYQCQDVARICSTGLTARLPGASRVIGEFVLLDPDLGVRKKVHPVGVVPVHVTDNDVRNVLGLQSKLCECL